MSLSVDGAVATLLVSNPPVNALSDAVLEALRDQTAAVAEDRDVRALILGGEGERTFIAGADLEAFAHSLGDRSEMQAHVELTAELFGALARLPIPVVAAVGGHAMGGGLELALVADFIVVDPRARLGFPEVTLGLMPGAGGTQRLGRRVDASTARRMLFLGESLTAQEALDAGLIDQVADPGQALVGAQQLAARLADAAHTAVSHIKAALGAADEAQLALGLAAERALFLEVAATDDAREGVTAFLAKRPPRFVHR